MKFLSVCVLSAAMLTVGRSADPVAVPEPSEKLKKALGADAVKIIQSAEKVEVFRVGDADFKETDASKLIARRVPKGDGKKDGKALPKELIARLKTALLDEANYYNQSSLGTGVGVGYRLIAADGAVFEFSCCIGKGNSLFTALDAKGRVVQQGGGGFREEPNKILRLIAIDALPDDADVQKMKPKAAPKSADPKPKDANPAEKPTAGAKPSPFEPGTKVQKITDGYTFTEGPTADKDGNVYFTDQPSDRILKWSVADDKVTTFLEKSGRANGLCFDADGKLWSCSDEKNELWKIDVSTKEHEVVVKDHNGKLLNGPNDVWVAPKGGAYFSDPFYKRKWWTRGPEEQDKRGVYFVSAKGVVSRVAGDFKQPNGVVGTADGKTLYVADIWGKQTFAFDIQDDGTLANRRKFCDMGSDGVTLDADGNLYLTGAAMTVFNKSGTKIAELAVPEQPSNVCFGGKDHKTLFITARTSLYSIPTRVAGGARQ